MVATDVASRGIGMIKQNLPLPLALTMYIYAPLTSCDSGMIALLSLAMFVNMFDSSRLFVSFLCGSQPRRALELTMQSSLIRLLNPIISAYTSYEKKGVVSLT